jgi:hypothetical protein
LEIVKSGHRQLELELFPPPHHLGRAPTAVGAPGDEPEVTVAIRPDPNDRRGRITDGSDGAFAPGVDDHRAMAWHLGGAGAKGREHGLEIRVEVRVVELHRPDEEAMWAVVEELRSAVEERAVVLVTLDHEMRPPADPESARVPSRKTTHQITRVGPGVLEDPREHGRGGGLAVCAGDDEAVEPATEDIVGDRLRLRQMGNVSFEHRDDLWIGARDRVADDDAVDFRRDAIGVETEAHRDFELFKDDAHRRVEVGVDALDAVAGLTQHSGQGGHRRAPDRKEIEKFFFEV